MGLLFGILSPILDIDLFQEEATREGEAQGQVGPLQAQVGGLLAVHPATLP